MNERNIAKALYVAHSDSVIMRSILWRISSRISSFWGRLGLAIGIGRAELSSEINNALTGDTGERYRLSSEATSIRAYKLSEFLEAVRQLTLEIDGGGLDQTDISRILKNLINLLIDELDDLNKKITGPSESPRENIGVGVERRRAADLSNLDPADLADVTQNGGY